MDAVERMLTNPQMIGVFTMRYFNRQDIKMSLAAHNTPRNMPQSLEELDQMFPDETSCANFLYSLKWRHGYRCPQCGHCRWWAARNRFECISCYYQSSVSSGTVFHKTRIPYTIWFRALWWLITQRGVPNKSDLRRIMKAKNFEPVTPMLAKLRVMLEYPDSEILTGNVEVNAFEILNQDRTASRRVLIAAEVGADGSCKIRLKYRCRFDSLTVEEFIKEHIALNQGVIHARGGMIPYTASGLGFETKHVLLSEVQDSPLRHHLNQLENNLRRLSSDVPGITPEMLALTVELQAFDFNAKQLSMGERFRRCLIQGLQPLSKARAWPPPPENDFQPQRESIVLFRDLESVLSHHTARYSEISSKKSAIEWLAPKLTSTPNDRRIAEILIDPKNARRRFRRRTAKLLREKLGLSSESM